MSVPMSLSPVSDPGYASSTSTPWLDKEDCERFPGDGEDVKHTLLQMEDNSARDDVIEMDPGSPSPPPYQQHHQHLLHQHSISSTPTASSSFRSHHQQSRSMFVASHSSKPSLSSSHNYGGHSEQDASISSRRAVNGLLPLTISTLSPPTIRLDLPAPSATSFYDSGTYWLTLYFFFNLSLTLYNKFALVSFPFPFSLTCIHSLTAFLGSYFCYQRGYFTRVQSLGMRETLILVAFSSLYTVNIAVSNLSLNLVTVPLHQVVRSTTPLFTIVMSICLFGKSYLFETYLSLIPVVIGVCLATYGDYSGTPWGVCLTLFGAWLASVKGIATNRILVGRLKFHPLDLLLRMSPLAFAQCLAFSYASGEMGEIYNRTFITGTLTKTQWFSLGINGALAFGLNLVSFTANKKTGALTMSVAANVKQVLTIVLAVVLFNLTINGVNLIGISLTIAGGAYYSYVEYKSKQKPVPAGVSSAPPLSPAAIGVSSTPMDGHYYEKLSPRPDQYSNPFLSIDQNTQTPPRHTAMTSGSSADKEKSTMHRRGNSLAGHQFAGKDQLSPPPF
ncbi:TPT-domain-containing protein [Cystobasidium minutum MCA 4210]|uniref:TPT-domain-containing protein n=1 Tax=Cystobasidium minutum MCA 4210 TaxID=1397322 RepID=UPI0034CF2B50|eukprot:jgi/Rhomi1/166769/fgenesh1_kg.2_\